MMNRPVPVALWIAAMLVLRAHAGEPGGGVQFNRDIRPILSDTCFKCHGPDSAARKAELRLDTREGALAEREGWVPIKPGDPARSEAYRRIVSDDPDEMMPPPDSGLAITPQQKKLIRKWIEEGAHFEKHWALIPPQRPVLPAGPRLPGGAAPVRNAIDRFVLQRLAREGLRPSPEADRTTLIRRVTLDLTGLPPTPREVEAFVADPAPDAYEKLVDRLLHSPRYGEHMARPWLDASRFADTNGYQVDTHRDMWLWRQWVIGAFSANMPFDQFTIEQIAGDLLPDATLEQKIASGFHRNHRINGEGGIIPEEFLVEYIVDRVDTTGTVWLGLTLGCARCHDHKYDPISQAEFYQLYAFFNTVPENGADGLGGPSTPFIKVPTEQQQAELDELVAQWKQYKKKMSDFEPKLAEAQAQWERQQTGQPLTLPSDGLVAAFDLNGPPPAAGASISFQFRDGEPSFEPSPFGQAADLDGRRYIDAGDLGRFEHDQSFSFGAWLYTYSDTSGAAIARMDEANNYRGYNLFVTGGAIIVQIISTWPDDAIQITTMPILKAQQWHHVFATYDGSGKVGGIKLYVDGKPVQATPGGTTLKGSIINQVPLALGSRSSGARFKGRIDEARLYSRVLPQEDVTLLAAQQLIATILATPADQRTKEQANTLREHFRANESPEDYRTARSRAQELEAHRKKLEATFATTMVMQEMEKPRDTFMLIRGEYDKPGAPVSAALPAALPPLPDDAPRNRLGLAQWLVSSQNPLTARVIVNRFWQEKFGTGLVATTEDFGSQAQWPSHPELLDWLSTEFVRTGWNVKAMQRLIVTSATYRQSSRITPQLAERDPGNRLLARGPRFRMPAEMIRDQALAASGLIVGTIGGPSVKPYQPPKLWEELTSGGFFSAGVYEQDKGPSLYRRSMYTYWKRTIPPPSMAIFDAPSREVCVVRRQRTNTPLQALALMNEEIYVESARHLARRMLREGGQTPQERIAYGWRLMTSRLPSPAEQEVVLASLQRRLREFQESPSDAQKLLEVGESPTDPQLDPAEHAAYTAVANLLMNLDEAITKE